jgi:hypothetical protein
VAESLHQSAVAFSHRQEICAALNQGNCKKKPSRTFFTRTAKATWTFAVIGETKLAFVMYPFTSEKRQWTESRANNGSPLRCR